MKKLKIAIGSFIFTYIAAVIIGNILYSTDMGTLIISIIILTSTLITCTYVIVNTINNNK